MLDNTGEWAMLLEACGLQVVRTIKYEREPPDSLADCWWYTRHPRALVKLALGGVVAAVCGEATFPRDEKNKAVAKAIAPRLTAAMNQRCRVESGKCLE